MAATAAPTSWKRTRKPLGDVVVRIERLSKVYEIPADSEKQTVRALADITLSEDGSFPPVRRGEFVILRGPSGGGKTTLLNILGTLDTMTTGKLEILGTVIDSSTKESQLASLRLHKIGFVFQTFNLLAALTAQENVELPTLLKGKLSRKQCTTRAQELLKAVGLIDRMGHLPNELSGGEQQRVTIARALSNNPEILLLDEPTGDLDSKNTVEIMDLLLKINIEQQTTCIMVTHNPDIECYADRILYVEDGCFVKEAINMIQVPLIYEDYAKYLNSKESTSPHCSEKNPEIDG